MLTLVPVNHNVRFYPGQQPICDTARHTFSGTQPETWPGTQKCQVLLDLACGTISVHLGKQEPGVPQPQENPGNHGSNPQN